MQRQPNQLACVELTNAAVDVYTTPTNIRTTVSSCTVTNKTATARWVTITITPSGGTARNVCYQRIVAAGESFVVGGIVGQTVLAAGKISATAEANTALDFVMSGYETVV